MPPSPSLRRAALALLFAAAPLLPVQASESASSAAAGGVSASVGSLSTSVEKSSASSSRNEHVAAGDYRVVEVAEAPGAQGRQRLRLEAAAGASPAEGFALTLPRETVDAARLRVGDVVSVRDLAHGIEFAAGTPRAVFFLALDVAGLRELQTRLVTL